VLWYDDGYDPQRTIAKTMKFINEDKVFALFCHVGTPTSVKIIPIVEDQKVSLIGLFTGANALRESFKRYIINIRSFYYQETGAVVKNIVEMHNARITIKNKNEGQGTVVELMFKI